MVLMVYNLELSAHFAPWGIFGLGVISTFWAQETGQEKTRKTVTIHKNFELYQVFKYTVQTVLIF